MSTPQVLVPLLDGFEEIEAVTIIDVLRRAEIGVTIAGEAPGPVRGAHEIYVTAEAALADLEADQFKMVVLPGGMPGSANLAAHPKVQSLIKEIAAAGNYACAICAAPIALAAAGLHHGKRYTCYPTFDQRIEGGTFVEDRVSIDGNLVTSRGPGTALDFAYALVKLLRDDDMSDKLRLWMLAGD